VNNVEVTVFLVSLKAGGVALNLTEASRVYLMDSWCIPRRLALLCIDPNGIYPRTGGIPLLNSVCCAIKYFHDICH